MESSLTSESNSHLKLRRLFVAILMLQLFCSLAVWLTGYFPPTIGFGAFSIPVNFRLLHNVLLSFNTAQLFLLALFLALAPQRVWQRFGISIGTFICIASLNVLGLLIFIKTAGAVAQIDYGDAVNFLIMALVITSGLSMPAWLIRIYRGSKLQHVNSQTSKIDRSETIEELVVLTMIVVAVLSQTSIRSSIDEIGGLSVIAMVIGFIGGTVVSIFAFGILKENTQRGLKISVGMMLGIFVMLPMICGYLSDFQLIYLPGLGSFLFPVSFVSAILLVQLLLLRAMGYRLRVGVFESAPNRGDMAKEVIDPLAD